MYFCTEFQKSSSKMKYDAELASFLTSTEGALQNKHEEIWRACSQPCRSSNLLSPDQFITHATNPELAAQHPLGSFLLCGDPHYACLWSEALQPPAMPGPPTYCSTNWHNCMIGWILMTPAPTG